MKRYVQNFLLMLQLLTRIPINLELPCEEEDFKRGSLFFCLVGLVIGAIQLVIYFIAERFFDINIAIIFIILIDIIITGGFHIDGFGDTADGFFAYKGKDKIIDIMKDSRIGTFAGIAIGMNLLIKFVGYGSALTAKGNILIILLVPMISRASIVLISYIGKRAKESGTGNLFINIVGLKEVIFNYLIFLVLAIFITNIFIAILLILVSLIATVLFNKYCESKINGITGDSLGATNELVTLIMLIILAT